MRSLQQAANRAVLDCFIAGKKPEDALEDVRASLAARGVRCSLAEVTPSSREGKVVDPREAEFLERVLTRSGMRRVLATTRQPDWRDIFSGALKKRGAGWLAAEPIAEAGVHIHAMLVVFGDTEEPNDAVLLALPAIAKACAPLLMLRRASDVGSERRHAMNNLLSTASANLGYVADLLDEGADASGAPDLKKALANARGAIREMAALVEVLTSDARPSVR